jgi:hypothetical protein
VFAFGDAGYFGSLPGRGVTPAKPIVGIASTPSGHGYWLVGADGAVYTFGDAGFHGSAPGSGGAPAAVVGLQPTSDGGGYWETTATGANLHFGDADTLGDSTPTAAITGISN